MADAPERIWLDPKQHGAHAHKRTAFLRPFEGLPEYVLASIADEDRRKLKRLREAAQDAEYWLIEEEVGPASVLDELRAALAEIEGDTGGRPLPSLTGR